MIRIVNQVNYRAAYLNRVLSSSRVSSWRDSLVWLLFIILKLINNSLLSSEVRAPQTLFVVEIGSTPIAALYNERFEKK